MHVRTVLLVVLAMAVALFAALNWSTFMAPTALSLGVATVDAPLGAIMLGLLAGASLLFLAWVIWLQGSVLLESRRQARELQAQRELADKAEASRFTELLARLEAMEQRQRAALDETGNTLVAYLGELEDRLEHRPVPPDVPHAQHPGERAAGSSSL